MEWGRAQRIMNIEEMMKFPQQEYVFSKHKKLEPGTAGDSPDWEQT